MNTQIGNNNWPTPQQPWGAQPQPYGPGQQQPYGGAPIGGPGMPPPYGGMPMGAQMPPQPPRQDPDEVKKKKTIRWIVLVGILDLLLLLLYLLLPSRCHGPIIDSSSEISETSDISDVVDNDSGELQFGIEWSRTDHVDIDAHCLEPSGEEIYWENQRSERSGGYLNIDNREGDRGRVEHIKWSKTSNMPDGDYLFYVQNFTGGRNSGVKAVLKTKDQTYTYQINNINDFRQDVPVVTVTIRDGQVANIKNHIQPS